MANWNQNKRREIIFIEYKARNYVTFEAREELGCQKIVKKSMELEKTEKNNQQKPTSGQKN